MAAQDEDAFMAHLFAGLDESQFDLPPSSLDDAPRRGAAQPRSSSSAGSSARRAQASASSASSSKRAAQEMRSPLVSQPKSQTQSRSQHAQEQQQQQAQAQGKRRRLEATLPPSSPPCSLPSCSLPRAPAAAPASPARPAAVTTASTSTGTAVPAPFWETLDKQGSRPLARAQPLPGLVTRKVLPLAHHHQQHHVHAPGEESKPSAAAVTPLRPKSTNTKANDGVAAAAAVKHIDIAYDEDEDVKPSPRAYEEEEARQMFEVKRERQAQDSALMPARVSQTALGERDAKKEKDDDRRRGEMASKETDELLDGIDFDDELMLSQDDDHKPSLASLAEVAASAGTSGSCSRTPRSQQYTRCRVISVTERMSEQPPRRPEVLLQVSVVCDGVEQEQVHQVILRDDWYETPVSSGDEVNLIGSFDATAPVSLILDRHSNLLVLHPEMLLSPTKVADSSHCARKAFVQTLVRTLGAAASPAIFYGNILHELMQRAMMSNHDHVATSSTTTTLRGWDEESRKRNVDDLLKRRCSDLWSMQLSEEKAREEVLERSKLFESFSKVYIGEEPSTDATVYDAHSKAPTEARLCISEIHDIEEDIWSPRFGLKGKIDVSLHTRMRDSDAGLGAGVPFARAKAKQVSQATMPFEIKTGRTVAANEHRAQTMLYTLLMADRYDEDVESGLLYYSTADQLIRVKAARNEIRGLMIARNTLADYLHHRMRDARPPPDEFDNLFSSQAEVERAATMRTSSCIPPPIDSFRSCKNCFVNGACMLYRTSVEATPPSEINDPELREVYEAKIGHLDEQDRRFFETWERLITYEEQEMVQNKNEIWALSSDERMRLGRCLAHMRLVSVETQGEQRYVCVLDTSTAPGLTELTVGDPVAVSLELPAVLAIARGFVLEISPLAVKLGLDRRLDRLALGQHTDVPPPAERRYRVDKDELAAGLGRIRDNVMQLFIGQREQEANLRRLVVHLEAPHFNPLDDEDEKAYMPRVALNSDQRHAISHVLAAQDYALILGMPGTGKTTTIVELVVSLVRAGKSVLLSAYTHSAVDNVMLKLRSFDIDMLRLGNPDKVMEELHPYTLARKDPAPETPEQYHNLVMRPQVVGATCLSINEPMFIRRTFDYCIVDEASQVTLPACIGPLRFADKFVLVGDHNQLPPLVKSRRAMARKSAAHSHEGAGLDISLFKRLADAHPASVAALASQYRMNDDICALANALVYHGALRVAHAELEQRTLTLPRISELSGPSWLLQALKPERKVVFLDTDRIGGRETKAGSLIENATESAHLVQLAAALVQAGLDPSSLGVIAFYRHQLRRLTRELGEQSSGGKLDKVEVLTADRSQGRDKECMLVSMTRSNDRGEVGDLIQDWRRINVAMTRARSKLIICGSRTTLERAENLEPLFKLVDERGWTVQL